MTGVVTRGKQWNWLGGLELVMELELSLYIEYRA